MKYTTLGIGMSVIEWRLKRPRLIYHWPRGRRKRKIDPEAWKNNCCSALIFRYMWNGSCVERTQLRGCIIFFLYLFVFASSLLLLVMVVMVAIAFVLLPSAKTFFPLVRRKNTRFYVHCKNAEMAVILALQMNLFLSPTLTFNCHLTLIVGWLCAQRCFVCWCHLIQNNNSRTWLEHPNCVLVLPTVRNLKLTGKIVQTRNNSQIVYLFVAA